MDIPEIIYAILMRPIQFTATPDADGRYGVIIGALELGMVWPYVTRHGERRWMYHVDSAGYPSLQGTGRTKRIAVQHTLKNHLHTLTKWHKFWMDTA